MLSVLSRGKLRLEQTTFFHFLGCNAKHYGKNRLLTQLNAGEVLSTELLESVFTSKKGFKMTTDTVTIHNNRKRSQIVFSVLIILALIGVVITDFSPSDAHGFWIFTLVVYACTAIFFERKSAAHQKGLGEFIAKQVIHWAGSLMAILCVYTLVHTGTIAYVEAGAIMLIILALATFLAGSHAGWRFYVLGALLASISIVMAYVEEFMWVITLACGLMITGTYFWTRYKAKE